MWLGGETVRITNSQLKVYKKEIAEILQKESNVILAAMRLLAPKDTGLLANTLKLEIKETDNGLILRVSSGVENTPRLKKGRVIKARDYFYPNENERFMGPRSIKREGQKDLQGKTIQPFIKQPLEDALDRALDTILARYGIRLGVGWRER